MVCKRSVCTVIHPLFVSNQRTVAMYTIAYIFQLIVILGHLKKDFITHPFGFDSTSVPRRVRNFALSTFSYCRVSCSGVNHIHLADFAVLQRQAISVLSAPLKCSSINKTVLIFSCLVLVADRGIHDYSPVTGFVLGPALATKSRWTLVIFILNHRVGPSGSNKLVVSALAFYVARCPQFVSTLSFLHLTNFEIVYRQH